jgi:CheY-like chemotaxis protein
MNAELRILNLEDNLADADLNEAMVSARWPLREFLRVETRAGFIAALEQKSFDLIFSDFTMPGFDGR